VRFIRSLRTQRGSISGWTAARLGAAAMLDEALLTTFQIVRSPADQDHFASRLDDAKELLEFLGRDAPAGDAPRYHERPGPAEFSGVERRVGHVRFRHASFPSLYRPPDSVPGSERFREQTDNRVAHAWILAHDRPAPWIVCVHGAGMGDPLADIFAFRAGALHRAGFNVAIPVLPHHGPRGAGRLATGFPTDDPTLNFHGAAQAITDVRAVLVAIEQRDEPAMLYGISLGGYVAAAVAALEPTVHGIVVGVPVVDLSALLRRHAPERFVRNPLFEPLCEVSELLESYSSPLALPVPSAPVRRVWAGRADRLVQPDQVEQIVDRWGDSTTCWYQGGHMGFLGLPRIRRFTREAIVDAGLGEIHRGRLRARSVEAIRADAT
jgi:pimeloyl-ACP methyl ester carboxylesterase